MKRVLEWQIDNMLFARTMISNQKNKLFLTKNTGLMTLYDNYVLESLNVQENHKDKNLRKSIVVNIRDYILENGKNFTFVDDEYRVQVGNKGFYIEFFFYNSGLSCLAFVAASSHNGETEY